MKKVGKLLFLIIILAYLVGCGGGGTASSGAANSSGGTGDVTISGTVAGTTVVAYDTDSSAVVARQIAVVSGSSKTFSIKVQSGKHYKFYLIENEGTTSEKIYPLYISNNNKFLVSTGTIDLGFVGTSTGNAIPSNIPTQFSNGIEDSAIPSGIATSQTSVYSINDLQGTWYVFRYIAGVTPLWNKSIMTVDASGNAAISNSVYSDGQSYTSSSVIFNISPSGAITMAGSSTGLIQMSSGKNLIIGTDTDNYGNPRLIVGVKAGATYSVSDWAGTWKWYGVGAGTSPFWDKGTLTCDSSGVATWIHTNSNGTNNSGQAQMSINSNGTITLGSNTYGAMTSDKQIVVTVDTTINTPAIKFYVKSGGNNFSVSDIYGTWRFSGLLSSYTSNSDYENVWSHYITVINSQEINKFARTISNGNYYATEGPSPLPVVPSTGIISLDSNGGEAIISSSKNILIQAKSSLQTGNRTYYELTVGMK